MSTKLKDLRLKIKDIDEELLTVLAKRFDVVRAIGEVKKQEGLEVLDEERWHEVLNSVLSKAEELNLSKEFVEKLYILIHEEALLIEEK